MDYGNVKSTCTCIYLYAHTPVLCYVCECVVVRFSAHVKVFQRAEVNGVVSGNRYPLHRLEGNLCFTESVCEGVCEGV